MCVCMNMCVYVYECVCMALCVCVYRCQGGTLGKFYFIMKDTIMQRATKSYYFLPLAGRTMSREGWIQLALDGKSQWCSVRSQADA